MELPTSFDVVIHGTGLTESLVAAAAARAGKTVLHLDGNSFYGARDATFNLRDLAEFLQPAAVNSAPSAVAPPPPSSSPAIRLEATPLKPRRVSFLTTAAPAAALAHAHRYNIDLSPRLLLSAGSMVETLR